MFKQRQQTGDGTSFAQQLKKKFSFVGGDGSRSPRSQRAQTSPNATSSPNTAQVSTRKRQPRLPKPEEEQQMSNMLNQKTSPTSNLHIKAYGQFFLEYSIAAEFNQVRKQKIPGVYVIPSFSNLLIWYGVIFVRHGIYQDGVFKFKLLIPANYPDSDTPSVVFSPPVFHPSVDASTGQLDLQKAFGAWRPSVNHIWQIFIYMRRIFYKIDLKDPVNKQAAELYETDLESFKKKVEDQISDISNQLYQEDPKQDDPHGIQFTQWNPELHEPLREQMFGPKDEISEENNNTSFDLPSLSGLSFIEPGTTLIFSKES